MSEPFNPGHLVNTLYSSRCPHDTEGEMSVTFADPAYMCSRCIEAVIVRAYLIGIGAGRRGMEETAETQRLQPVEAP